MDEKRKEARIQARKMLKEYHSKPGVYDQAGERLLKQAEKAQAEKHKEGTDEINDVCQEMAGYFSHKALNRFTITMPGNKRKRKMVCDICGGTPGVYYIEDGKTYGSCCKHLIGATKQEREELLCH